MKAYLTAAHEAVRSVSARRAAWPSTGVGILAASAWLSVPFYPVPLTMQTLAVLLIGGMLGPVPRASRRWSATWRSARSALPCSTAGWAARPSSPGPPAVTSSASSPPRSSWVGPALGRTPSGRSEPGGPPPGGWVCWPPAPCVASAAVYAVGVPWLALSTGLGMHKRYWWRARCPSSWATLLKVAVAVGAVYLGSKAVSCVEAFPLLKGR